MEKEITANSSKITLYLCEFRQYYVQWSLWETTNLNHKYANTLNRVNEYIKLYGVENIKIIKGKRYFKIKQIEEILKLFE